MSSGLPTIPLLPYVWAMGTVLLAAILGMANLRFWRRVAREPLCTDAKVLTLLETCKADMGVRVPVVIVESDSVRSPALFGFLRPRLLIPRQFLAELNPAELRHVLLHELAHIKRHDIVLNWLVALLQVVHWFNPLLWFAFRRMRSDRELVCDAMVLHHTSADDTEAYGGTILRLFERAQRSPRVPGMAGIVEEKSQLRRRITMIALFERKTYRWSALAVALFIALGAVTLTGASAEPEANQPTPTPAPGIEAAPPAADEAHDVPVKVEVVTKDETRARFEALGKALRAYAENDPKGYYPAMSDTPGRFTFAEPDKVLEYLKQCSDFTDLKTGTFHYFGHVNPWRPPLHEYEKAWQQRRSLTGKVGPYRRYQLNVARFLWPGMPKEGVRGQLAVSPVLVERIDPEVIGGGHGAVL